MSIWNNNFPIFVRGFLPRKIFPGKRIDFVFYLDSEARESPLWPSLATADAEKVTKDSILPTYPVRV